MKKTTLSKLIFTIILLFLIQTNSFAQIGTGGFVTVWNFDNADPNYTSGPNTIRISISQDAAIRATYDFDVFWGDGMFQHLTSSDIQSANSLAGPQYYFEHTYMDSTGDKTITISGTFPQIRIGRSFDRNKIKEVQNWGNIQWLSMELAFEGCTYLDVTATDTPDLSAVTDCSQMFYSCINLVNSNASLSSWDTSNVINMQRMFYYCTNFNQPLNWDTSSVTDMSRMFGGCTNFNQLLNWNTSSVTDMSGMFSNCANFNQSLNWNTSSVTNMSNMFAFSLNFDQNIGNWNVESLTDASGMFAFDTLSTANYDALLIGWNSQNLHQNVDFDGGNSKYCLGEPDRLHMINLDNWNIQDAGLDTTMNCDTSSNDFVTTWNLGDDPDPTIVIPTFPGETYNYDVDWNNDGVFDDFGFTGDASHTYTGVPYTVTIRIRGQFPRIYFNLTAGSHDNIISVDQWGTQIWTSMENAFAGCHNLADAVGEPDLSIVQSTAGMFMDCNNFNGQLENWDTSNITNMANMFYKDDIFNCNLSNWSTSNVTDMSNMFTGCGHFKQDLGSWVVTSLANANGMFDLVNLNETNTTTNYDNLLTGWSSQVLLNNVTFSGGMSKYCNGENARNNMINGNNWVITDGGLDCNTAGINNLNNSTIIIKPNPSNGVFKINLDSPSNNITYTVKDILGRTIATYENSNSEFSINLSNYKNGTYLLLIKTSDISITKKIIKK